MVKPQIIVSHDVGKHNSDLSESLDRLYKGNTYKDCSTMCIIPTRGYIHARVVQSIVTLLAPMNQKFNRIFMMGMEVGDAYSSAIETILDHHELSKWKYILTMEDDNLPPPDGLLKLIESLEGGVDGNRYDVVGGLYWTKGEGGQPMAFGDPHDFPLNFRPQIPKPDTVTQVNGLGMGFTLFRMDIFKNKDLPRPFFKTVQEFDPQSGVKSYTQDLKAMENMGKLGYRFAVDSRVRVGHLEVQGDHEVVW